jgi:hypothetical protein
MNYQAESGADSVTRGKEAFRRMAEGDPLYSPSTSTGR